MLWLTWPLSHLQAGAKPFILWQLLQVGHKSLPVPQEREHVANVGSTPGVLPALLASPGWPWELVWQSLR